MLRSEYIIAYNNLLLLLAVFYFYFFLLFVHVCVVSCVLPRCYFGRWCECASVHSSRLFLSSSFLLHRFTLPPLLLLLLLFISFLPSFAGVGFDSFASLRAAPLCYVFFL